MIVYGSITPSTYSKIPQYKYNIAFANDTMIQFSLGLL